MEITFFFHSLGNPKSYMIDFLCLKHFSYLAQQIDTKIDQLAETFPRYQRKTAKGHSIIGMI